VPLGLRFKRKVKRALGEGTEVQAEGLSLELPLGLLSRGIPCLFLKVEEYRILLE